MIGPAPQSQTDQFGDPSLRERLMADMSRLPRVTLGHSRRAPTGTVGFNIADHGPVGPPEAFLLGREFAHVHPAPECGLHAVLPQAWLEAAIRQGWAELHPLAGQPTVSAMTVFIYAPRTNDELTVVEQLVEAAHAWATSAANGAD